MKNYILINKGKKMDTQITDLKNKKWNLKKEIVAI